MLFFWSSLCKDVVDFNEECSGLAFGLQAGNHSHLRRQEDAENGWQWLEKGKIGIPVKCQNDVNSFQEDEIGTQIGK